MAHPKSRISKQRKRQRRTHYKIDAPNVVVCKNTGEAHLRHHAYSHEGNLFYKGNMIVKGKEVVEAEDEGAE
jgi:large subunit ribosomal protein L32